MEADLVAFVGLGFVPDPTGGAYSPRPLAAFRGLLLKGGENMGWEGMEGKGVRLLL